MSESKNSNKLTMTQLLVPMSLMSFTLMLLFAFQTTQILRDRDSLHEVIAQQERPLEESNRLLAQIKAVVTGTQKLSEGGNKSAKLVIDRLKAMGVIGEAPQQPTPPPVPMAPAMPGPGPIKP